MPILMLGLVVVPWVTTAAGRLIRYALGHDSASSPRVDQAEPVVHESPTEMVPPPVETELRDRSFRNLRLLYQNNGSNSDLDCLSKETPGQNNPSIINRSQPVSERLKLSPHSACTSAEPVVHQTPTDMVPCLVQTEPVHQTPTDVVPCLVQTEPVHQTPTDVVPRLVQTEPVHQTPTDMVPRPVQTEPVHQTPTDVVPRPVQTEPVHQTPTDMVPRPVRTEVRGRSRTEKHDVETQHPAGRGSEKITKKHSTARDKIAAIFSRAQAKIAALNMKFVFQGSEK
ncbi:uncharacterized protein LOC123958748 [Micropterus dolomieu]|uniref:uncharacterized protein LOC123958748 n=1 Tax=Micropterus dolomieu TaxID=147949 RepID=UPI001E8EC108|nr:uncharacterized protein LOC123958748 [Micropterus dolomieu]